MSNRDGRTREHDRRRRGGATGADDGGPAVPAELTRQLLRLHHPGQRVSNEAVELTSQLLRLFIVEARRRAASEAECEADIAPTARGDDGSGSRLAASDDSSDADGGADGGGAGGAVRVGPGHVAMVAAELLMDFS